MTALRFGVLGCAEIARRRMLPAMAAGSATTVTAVAGRDRAKAERTAAPYGAAAVQGYAALLERDDVDAVYVPLPAALHAPWVERALRAGKHVLAEKPLTTDAVDTARLLDLAKERGLVLRENVMFVHHSQHAAVASVVRGGVIGELRAFQAAFTIPRLPGTDIRHRPELGGGALFDVGVYPLRAALTHLGHDLRVLGAQLTGGPGDEVDTAGAALLSTPTGVTAQLTFGMDHGYRSGYELHGSLGRISLDAAYTPRADHRPRLVVQTRAGVEESLLEADDQVANTVAAFAEAVRTGGPPEEVSRVQAELLASLRQVAGLGAPGDHSPATAADSRVSSADSSSA
ncbi:Gfo/Idh/MocA family oxidoreductase [Streptomyces avermitilis]|uniref:Gfo/Idh/MocA family protein n=1 Tax=Streptomyces avermitilis TaxID=33903 RepID=UPI00340E1671